MSLRRLFRRDRSRRVLAHFTGNTAQDICPHGAVRSWSGTARGGGMLPAIEQCENCDDGSTALQQLASYARAGDIKLAGIAGLRRHLRNDGR